MCIQTLNQFDEDDEFSQDNEPRDIVLYQITMCWLVCDVVWNQCDCAKYEQFIIIFYKWMSEPWTI